MRSQHRLHVNTRSNDKLESATSPRSNLSILHLPSSFLIEKGLHLALPTTRRVLWIKCARRPPVMLCPVWYNPSCRRSPVRSWRQIPLTHAVYNTFVITSLCSSISTLTASWPVDFQIRSVLFLPPFSLLQKPHRSWPVGSFSGGKISFAFVKGP